MKKYYIGIDPDAKASGFAIWDKEAQKLKYVKLLKFWELFHTLFGIKELHGAEVNVIIEAGWLNKGHWHPNKNQGVNVASRIGNNVGANHQTGRIIEEMCQYLKLDYQLVKPVKSKITAKTFEQVTGIKKSNQDTRDAVMLVWGR